MEHFDPRHTCCICSVIGNMSNFYFNSICTGLFYRYGELYLLHKTYTFDKFNFPR